MVLSNAELDHITAVKTGNWSEPSQEYVFGWIQTPSPAQSPIIDYKRTNKLYKSYPMRWKGRQKWRVGGGAVFRVCDLLKSYDLASLLAELPLLADSQPTRHFCSPFPQHWIYLITSLVFFILPKRY